MPTKTKQNAIDREESYITFYDEVDANEAGYEQITDIYVIREQWMLDECLKTLMGCGVALIGVKGYYAVARKKTELKKVEYSL